MLVLVIIKLLNISLLLRDTYTYVAKPPDQKHSTSGEVVHASDIDGEKTSTNTYFTETVTCVIISIICKNKPFAPRSTSNRGVDSQSAASSRFDSDLR